MKKLVYILLDLLTVVFMIGAYAVQVGDPASADCVHTTVGELPTGKAAK